MHQHVSRAVHHFNAALQACAQPQPHQTAERRDSSTQMAWMMPGSQPCRGAGMKGCALSAAVRTNQESSGMAPCTCSQARGMRALRSGAQEQQKRAAGAAAADIRGRTRIVSRMLMSTDALQEFYATQGNGKECAAFSRLLQQAAAFVPKGQHLLRAGCAEKSC